MNRPFHNVSFTRRLKNYFSLPWHIINIIFVIVLLLFFLFRGHLELLPLANSRQELLSSDLLQEERNETLEQQPLLQQVEPVPEDTQVIYHSADEELEALNLRVDIAQADMLIIIYTFDSAEQNIVRDVARKTWMPLLLKQSSIRILFFAGLDGRDVENNRPWRDQEWVLTKEQQLYRDIVFLNHYESYKGLSNKMVKTYQWLAEHRRLFPLVQWTFKVDTDTYLYIPEFLKFASDVSKIEPVKTMVGRSLKRTPVFREGSWANKDIELDMYPTYMAGAGYWISQDLVEWIGWSAAKGWLSTMPNEDALLGVWFLGLNVRFLNDQRIRALGGDHEMKMDSIPRKNCYSWAVYHNLNLAGILDTHKRVEMCGSPCVICSP